MNCSFLAAEAGGHTLEAIGEMLGMTREGVRLIQVRALEKLRACLEENSEQHEFTIYESSLAAGPGYVDTDDKGNECSNQGYVVSAING